MKRLLQILDEILNRIDQIENMTLNQTTVLIEMSQIDMNEDKALDVLEEITNYKDQAINELEKVEKEFQIAYEPFRGKITDKTITKELQSKITQIMEKKKAVTDTEKNNLMIMQTNSRKQVGTMEIPRSASRVSDAYKKQQNKS